MTGRRRRMIDLGQAASGEFCWVDLAAADAGTAKEFYEKLFGWSAREQPASGGSFTRLLLSGRDVGSMYQLAEKQLAAGVPSHWTPYVRVDDADGAVRRAASIGGRLIVRPFAASGMARIALIQDSVGALVGLWESAAEKETEDRHG
jgi:predicted enzyme related to lactoylglutathione lyase